MVSEQTNVVRLAKGLERESPDSSLNSFIPGAEPEIQSIRISRRRQIGPFPSEN